MTMNRMFAGLIAFVAGVALSAGSAFAQDVNGYVGGDPAVIKLIPYYEAGETKATIIGVQNMSMQEATTVEQHALVMDIQTFLMGGDNAISARAATALTAEGATVTADTTTLGENDLNLKALAEAALEKAMMAVMTEHLFVSVNVYDGMGMMVGTAELCLAENQFGVVVLQGSSAMMMDGYQMQTLSMMDDEIPAYGWMKVIAETQKLSECGAGSRANPRVNIDTRPTAGTGDAMTESTKTRVAAWTIIQDVGMGFFGTEVPTATASLEMTAADTAATPNVAAGDPEMACYSTPTTSTTTAVAYTAGDFMMSRCGLIPERKNNTRTADTDTDMNGHDDPTADTATPRGSAYARYDTMDESMIVLWLAGGEDTMDTHPRDSRDVQVMIQCEDGMVISKMDNQFGDPVDIMIDAPEKLTMIDPAGDTLGDLTAMCDGYRGVLQIMMPDGSRAGMAFTHITQMDGHYRMNFPAYSMASGTACTAAAGNCP